MGLSWSVIEAPTARSIPAWGEAPRKSHLDITFRNPRAESPDYPSGGDLGDISHAGVTDSPAEWWGRGTARQATLVPAMPGCLVAVRGV